MQSGSFDHWEVISTTPYVYDPYIDTLVLELQGDATVRAYFIFPTWDCDSQGNCLDPGTGLGAYVLLSDCQSNCVQTAIEEHSTSTELLKVTDLLGRETKGTKNKLLFYIYDDGTVEKRIVIE